ncbi:ATP-binding protein [Thermaerobacter litoralis]
MPPIYAQVQRLLCSRRPDGYGEFAQILLLHREFPARAVTEALEEAAAQGLLEAQAVRQLILNRLARPAPKPVSVPDRWATVRVRVSDLYIYLGPTGTGKTHTAIALGVVAIHAGWRVRFTTAVALGQELLQAHNEARLPKVLKGWDRFDLVVLDELGYLGLGPAGPLRFQFCAHRYKRGSLLITTNLEFSRWVEVFGDAALTSVLLDRLTHRSHVLLFNGES